VIFKTVEQLREVAGKFSGADFDRAAWMVEQGAGRLTLTTSRPPGPDGSAKWIPCQLVIRGIQGVELSEVGDLPAETPPLLQAEPAGPGFKIRLASARALRLTLTVGRLDGEMTDL